MHFKRVGGRIEKHIDGILEYIRNRLSNGRTERPNGNVRASTRQTFGFHSAAAWIAMVLFSGAAFA